MVHLRCYSKKAMELLQKAAYRESIWSGLLEVSKLKRLPDNEIVYDEDDPHGESRYWLYTALMELCNADAQTLAKIVKGKFTDDCELRGEPITDPFTIASIEAMERAGADEAEIDRIRCCK